MCSVTTRLSVVDQRQVGSLEELGLRAGETVRFRRPDRARWQIGRIAGREADGSVRITDGNGAARTIPLHLVEVKRRGVRGAMGWEPLPERAARTEQLGWLD